MGGTTVSTGMKLLMLVTALFACCAAFGQKDRRFSAYASLNVNNTLYDRTLSNNAVGFGAGIQVNMRTGLWARPLIDISADGYGGTKQMYLTADGKPIFGKSEVVNVLGGILVNLPGRFFASLTAGPSVIDGSTYFGIKPAIGYYCLPGRQLAARVAFTNVYQRDHISNQSFGTLVISAAVKLF